MKKMLFCLFFSFIIFVSFNLNVSAARTIDFTTNYDSSQLYSFDLSKESFDKLIDKLDTFDKEYVILSYRTRSASGISEFFSSLHIYLFEKESELNIFPYSPGDTNFNLAVVEDCLFSNNFFSSNYITNVINFENYVENLDISNFTTKSDMALNVDYEGLSPAIYYSSKDLILSDLRNLDYTFKLGDEIFTTGDKFITVYDYLYGDSNENEDVYDFTSLYEHKSDLAYMWYENSMYNTELVNKSVVDRIKGYMDSRDKYYMILFKNNSSSSNQFYDQYYTSIQIFEFDSIPYFYFNSDDVFKSSINGYYVNIDFNTGSSLSSAVNNTNTSISQLESISLSDNISSTNGSYIFRFDELYETAGLTRNNAAAIYYANFDVIYHHDVELDIKIGDEIISNGDKLPTIYEYLNPSSDIDFTLKETFNTNSIGDYTLSFGISKLLIESQNKFNFKIETSLTGIYNNEFPDTPIFKLYRKQNDELILVDNDNYIIYDWLESSNNNNYYLDGYIEFSNEVSYVNDYVLEISFSNIDYATINVYDDSIMCSWTGSYDFLKNYNEYVFKGGSSGYAISYNNDFKGKIYVETKYINEPYNFGAGYYHYSTKTRGEELLFNEFSNGEYSYIDFTIEYFNNSQDKNHILTVFKNIENNDDVVFYVPKELTVSLITVSNINDDGTVDFEFIMNTPNGEGTFDEEFNYNFGDEEFINTFTGAINFFVEPIKEIFKLIAVFYNNLSVPLKMFFISLFGLGISVFIVRFLL